jgi:hypothetical protein
VKKFFKYLIRAILFYWGFSMLIGLVKFFNLPKAKECYEFSELDSLSGYYLHQRSWKAYETSMYGCISYLASDSDRNTSYSKRVALPYPKYDKDHYEDYWGKVYESLNQIPSEVVSDLKDSLTAIIIQEGYDHYETADLIVSMIQDIPYTLIKRDGCTDDDIQPCVGNQKFGLMAPSEFMYDLNGDCDTRAVFLHKLLTQLGYDTVVVVSREYGHAMIAINLPVSGDYIEYQGVPYYFWETTAKGWKVGMLPPSYPETKYWHIALGPKLS